MYKNIVIIEHYNVIVLFNKLYFTYLCKYIHNYHETLNFNRLHNTFGNKQ